MKTKTEQMFATKSPYMNPYQGTDKKVLFVCSAGLLRSATAARIYANQYNTRAAGSEDYALIPVTADLLMWADEVVFVNEDNYKNTSRTYDLDNIRGRYIVLNIEDQYDHMNPQLIKEFNDQYMPVK